MPLFSDEFNRQHDPDGYWGEYGMTQIFAIKNASMEYRKRLNDTIYVDKSMFIDDSISYDDIVYLAEKGGFTINIEKAVDKNVVVGRIVPSELYGIIGLKSESSYA